MFKRIASFFRRAESRPALLRKPLKGAEHEMVYFIRAKHAGRPDLPPEYPAIETTQKPHETDKRPWLGLPRLAYEAMRQELRDAAAGHSKRKE